jgi:hypothetical protein
MAVSDICLICETRVKSILRRLFQCDWEKATLIFGRSNGVVVNGSVFMDSGLAGYGRLVRD